MGKLEQRDRAAYHVFLHQRMIGWIKSPERILEIYISLKCR